MPRVNVRRRGLIINIKAMAIALVILFLGGITMSTYAVSNEEQEIAKRVVRDVLKLKKGDFVLINTWAHTLSLAEAISIEASRAGAVPTITYESDYLYATRLEEIPEETLRQVPEHLLAAYDKITAVVELAGPKNPAVFDKGSPAKLGATQDSWKPISDKSRERKVRGCYIEAGFATKERAKRYGVDYKKWSASINDALTADLSEIKKKGEVISKIIEAGKEFGITAPNGTDLTFTCEGRRSYVSDGQIDQEDIERDQTWVSLPTGDAYTTIVETSANGKFILDKVALWGKIVEKLEWDFKEGKLTGWSAKANQKIFDEFIGGASGDKDRIAGLSVGLNPKARPTGMGLSDWIVEGAISIGLGGNKESGGQNDSTFMWSGTLVDATLTVDGKVIVEKGKLKI